MTNDHLARIKLYDLFLTLATIAVGLLMGAVFAIMAGHVAGPAEPIPVGQQNLLHSSQLFN